MRVVKMSNDELRQQAETINTMAGQLKSINKLMVYMPLFGVVGTLLSGAFALGVFLYKYDVNIVKQPQFSTFKVSVAKTDSTLNAKIDTNYSHTNKRFDSLPVYRLVNATQRRDKNGNIRYTEVN